MNPLSISVPFSSLIDFVVFQLFRPQEELFLGVSAVELMSAKTCIAEPIH